MSGSRLKHIKNDVGCLFDFNEERQDVYKSMNKPIICPDCQKQLLEKINIETLREFQNRLKKIRKPVFYRLKDWGIYHPFQSFLYASILLGILSSMGNSIWEWIKVVL